MDGAAVVESDTGFMCVMGLLRTMTVLRVHPAAGAASATTAATATTTSATPTSGAATSTSRSRSSSGSWNKRMRHLSSPVLYLTALLAKARRKEKADVAGVTGGSSAGLGGGGGGLGGLAGSVSLPGCGGMAGGNGHPALGAGQLMMGQAGGAHGPYGDAEQKLYLESTVLERKIPEADLRQLVDLPPGLDLNEWLASHTIAFFEHVNLLYGAVSEYCTPTTCPDMLGPGQRQYHWIDERGKKIRLSAPQYIDYVMTYAQRTVNDESIFPTKFAHEFPATYEQILRKIQRLLFHVVAHLYHRHFRELLLLGLHGHLHALFAHLILFNRRFHLIDDKETEILNDLVIALRLQPSDEKSSSSIVPSTTPRSGQPSPTPLQVTNDSNSGTDASTGVHENHGPGNAQSCQQHVRSGSGQDQCHVGASSSTADGADSR